MILSSPDWRAAFARLAVEAQRPRGTLLLWIGLVGLYLGTASYGSVSSDVSAAYLPAWALAQHHTANVDGYQYLSIWLHDVGGHLRSDRYPGAILIAVPAYWLFGTPSYVTIEPSILTVGLMTATTVVLMYRTLLRLVGPGYALAGALVLGLGTGTWTVSADAQWTHTSTQLGLALVLYGLASRRPWLSGLGMVLSAAARPHTSVVAAILGIGDWWRTRRIWTAVLLAGGTLVGFAIILAWSGATLDHASLLPSTYAGRGSALASAGSTHGWLGWPLNLSGFVVSPERGVLVLCPFVVPCLYAVRRVWRPAPGWVRDAAIGAVVYSVVQLAGNGFAGGWGFFGFRLALEGMTLATPLLVLGARSVCRDRRWAWATGVLVGYSLCIHILGAVWYTNVNEGDRWWKVYQPVQMALATPWHAAVALLGGAVLTVLVVGVARSDPPDDSAAYADARTLSEAPAAP